MKYIEFTKLWKANRDRDCVKKRLECCSCCQGSDYESIRYWMRKYKETHPMNMHPLTLSNEETLEVAPTDSLNSLVALWLNEYNGLTHYKTNE